MSWLDDIKKMLAREAPGSKIETTDGNHLRIILPNGARVICAKTPGDGQRALLNVRGNVRRALKEKP
jgi:hypothetical protein